MRPRTRAAAAGGGFSDTFARTAGTLGTADVGGAWTQHAGTISTDGANANQGSLVLTYASLPASANGTLTMHSGNTSPDNYGVLFRYVDANNYWYYVVFSTNVFVKKKVAGVSSTPGGGVAAAAVAPGDAFQVILSGSSIITKLRGVQMHSLTDPDLATAVRHGLYSETNTLGIWQDIAFA